MKAAYVAFLLLLSAAIASKQQAFSAATKSTEKESDRPQDTVGVKAKEDPSSGVQFKKGKVYRFAYRTTNVVQGSHDDRRAPQNPDTRGPAVDVQGGGLRLHAAAIVRVVGRDGDAALCELRVEDPTFAVFNPKLGRFGPAARDPDGLGKLLEGPSNVFTNRCAAVLFRSIAYFIVNISEPYTNFFL